MAGFKIRVAGKGWGLHVPYAGAYGFQYFGAGVVVVLMTAGFRRAPKPVCGADVFSRGFVNAFAVAAFLRGADEFEKVCGGNLRSLCRRRVCRLRFCGGSVGFCRFGRVIGGSGNESFFAGVGGWVCCLFP